MKKIVWALLALIVVTSLLVASCGRATPEPTDTPVPVERKEEPTKAPEPTPEPEPAGPSGTVTLWHAWKENEIESLNDVIAAFQAENPDVQFDVLYVPFDDLRGKFETAVATGGGPSVLIGAADWGPALFDAELVADLSLMADTAFLRTINPAALGAVKYKGALIGLPQTIKGVVMYRNTSIIPEAPATFEDLVAAAKAATAGDTVGANLEYGFFFAAAHLNGVGGLLMDEKGNPLFNDAKGVEWLNLLNSFKDAGPTEYYTDNDVNLFKAGKAGVIIDGTWNMAGLAEAIGAENLAVDPWPKGMSGYAQTENIYMSANAAGDDQMAAWAFMEFFLSPEAQALLADPTKAGHIPAVAGVEVTDPLMAQAAEAFAGGAAFPVIPEMGAYWGPMDTALKSVFDEGADPAAVLSQAYNSVTAAIAEIRGEAPPEETVAGTVSLWQSWKENEIESLNAVIAAFQEKYPDVQFDVLYVPFDDLRGKFETAVATGGGPSVLVGAADWGPALFDAELVADVRGFTSAPFLASINEAALGAVEYKGALIGLPQTIKGVVMYRNTSIIPEAPATYEDLVAAAQAATAGDVVGADLEYGFFFAAAHLDGVGGALMDKNGDPLFNDEKGVEWLNLLNSFKDAGPTEYYTDNDVNLFKAGKAGVIIDGTWNMAGLAEAIGAENLAVDPWPAYGDGHLSGYAQTENIYMSANAAGDDQMAAWKFMEFFLSPEAQALLADPTKAGHIPAVAGVEVADPLMLQATEAFAAGAAFPVIPEMGAYWGPMDTALKSVFDEGMDPAEVLQTAFESITAAIEEIRGG
ncbi:MAG: extracellular solute-binding protein [Chloroflexi bacterium]|nr:extracellular solute-binding protein [Chloroflexota bacterium]